MLHLYQSNRLEPLAEAFARRLRETHGNPLLPEQVVVQNAGMGRWLSLQTARLNGIAANMRYLFPAELTWELLRKVLEDVPEKDPCAPAMMRWRLLDVFLREGRQWPELASYLQGGEEAAWQLAGQVSTAFDQYLFFRPEWIREWEQGGGAADDWQARLWRKVAGERRLPHWVRLQERFINALGVVGRERLPERISFFSMQVLSPGYVQLLGEAARYIDIELYFLNPSQEYWGDIESEKRKRKREARGQEHIEVGNPLLASWGRQGRDFWDQLVELGAREQDLFVEPRGDSLLRRVQADILHLEMPEEPEPWSSEDDSIRLHACHSPMREAEVLYDQLLALFGANPDLTPTDVVVMTPDIDAYAPYIEAVFSSGALKLPYSIADRHASAEQGVQNLCLHLLELPLSRFDAESILTLLEFAEVREHTGLDETQAARCREWIRAANIRWGTDASQRGTLGGAATPEHTWRQGLERLLLGYAMPGEELFEGILPYNDIEGSQALVLGNLLQLLETVFELAAWRGLHLPAQGWAERFRNLLPRLVDEDTAALASVWQALDNLVQNAALAECAEPLPWAVFRKAFSEQLDKRSEAEGFLGRGITFCALLPMRTVPFRCVALLGMNDGVFPRRDVRASFNRMAHVLRRGDRLRRDEDRYLFLESLLSARQWLYISYVGLNPQDNQSLPPSVLVSELLDYLQRRFVVCAEDGSEHPLGEVELLTRHPLQAFSPRYLHARDGLFTYNPDFSQLDRQAEKRLANRFWEGALLPEADARYRDLALVDLSRFYRCPAREFLRCRFGLRLGEADLELPVREPFELEPFQDGEIRGQIFDHLARGQGADSALPYLRAQGLLPHGVPGELLFTRERQTVETFYQRLQPLPELSRQLFMWQRDGFYLSGVVGNLGGRGRETYLFKAPSYWDWVDIWIQHLALNLLEERGCPPVTLVHSPAQSWRLGVVEDAAGQMRQLLTWYWEGLREPLPFFPKSALAMMEHSEHDIGAAYGKWNSSYGYAGEGDKPEYRLLYRDSDPLAEQEARFRRIAEGFFGGMLAARQELENC